MNNKLVAGVAALLALGTAGMAKADLITNGNFSQSSYAPGVNSHQFGTGYGGQGVTGWTGNGGYGLYFQSNPTIPVRPQRNITAVTVPAPNICMAPPANSPPIPHSWRSTATRRSAVETRSRRQSTAWSPASSTRSPSIGARTSFGAVTVATTEQLQVSLGSQTLLTPVISDMSPPASAAGRASTLMFTATSTSEVLTFLSLGTPDGLPPIAVLDNVSLTVPEPSSIGLLGAGLAFLGFTAARRRRNAL